MKVHLLDTDDPLKEGQEYLANCGQRIPQTVFAFLWDSNSLEMPALNALRLCRHCRNFAFTHRYIYGLVSGQESMQGTEDAA